MTRSHILDVVDRVWWSQATCPEGCYFTVQRVLRESDDAAAPTEVGAEWSVELRHHTSALDSAPDFAGRGDTPDAAFRALLDVVRQATQAKLDVLASALALEPEETLVLMPEVKS